MPKHSDPMPYMCTHLQPWSTYTQVHALCMKLKTEFSQETVYTPAEDRTPFCTIYTVQVAQEKH